MAVVEQEDPGQENIVEETDQVLQEVVEDVPGQEATEEGQDPGVIEGGPDLTVAEETKRIIEQDPQADPTLEKGEVDLTLERGGADQNLKREGLDQEVLAPKAGVRVQVRAEEAVVEAILDHEANGLQN